MLVRSGSGISSLKFSRNPLVLFHNGSIFEFRLKFYASWQIVDDSGFPNVLFQLPLFLFALKQGTIMDSTHLVSWIASHTAFSRRLSTDLLCLLLSSGNNMYWQITLSFLQFPMEFLSRTRVSAALNKIGNLHLKREFRRKNRSFLEEFTNSVLFTVAARSNIGQRLSCFCPAIIIGGDFIHLVLCWMGF